jgi:Virulence factor BrkB
MSLFARHRETATTAERLEGRLPPDDSRKPGSPTDLPKRSWLEAGKRAVTESRDDDITDWAASLTYYGLLSMFPAMIVLLALLGIFGQQEETIFGAEVNAELERGRELYAGLPAEEDIKLPHRRRPRH